MLAHLKNPDSGPEPILHDHFSTLWYSTLHKPNIFWNRMSPTIHWRTARSLITHRIHIIWPFAFSVIYMNGWKSSGEWCYHCVWTVSKVHVLHKVIFLMTMFTLSISGRRLVVYPVSVETRLSWSEFKVLHIDNFSEIIIFFFFIFWYILSLPGLSACYWI